MKKLRITIDNKSYDVTVEDLTDADAFPTPVAPASASVSPIAATGGQLSPAPQAITRTTQQSVEFGSVTSPMAGAIKSVLVKPGDTVKHGQSLVILEAMKMENQITAPAAGTVRSVGVAEGDTVTEGHVLVVVE